VYKKYYVCCVKMKKDGPRYGLKRHPDDKIREWAKTEDLKNYGV